MLTLKRDFYFILYLSPKPQTLMSTCLLNMSTCMASQIQGQKLNLTTSSGNLLPTKKPWSYPYSLLPDSSLNPMTSVLIRKGNSEVLRLGNKAM